MSNEHKQAIGPTFRFRGQVNEATMNALTTPLDGDYVSRTDESGEGSSVSATGQILILDYTLLSGVTFTLKGTTVTEGVEFTAATSNDATAASLATALDAIAGETVTNSTNEANIVNNTAGTIGNETGLSTNATALGATVSGALLTGGLRNQNIVWIYNNGAWSNALKGLIGEFKKSKVTVQEASVEFLVTTGVSKEWRVTATQDQVFDDRNDSFSGYITAIPTGADGTDSKDMIRIVAW